MDLESMTEGGVLIPIDDELDLRPVPAEAGRSMVRQVLWLSAPVLVEQGLAYLVGLSDTILTGRYLSEDYLAAVTVSTYLLWFLGSLMTIISVGATALVARLTGAREPEAANRVCQQAVGLALMFGTAVLIAGEILAPSLIRALNLEGRAAGAATMFLRVLLLVMPFLALATAGFACLRGVGDTRTGMWVMMAVNAVNVTLTWSLVRGWGPIPRLGFPGIAIGTAVSEVVGGLAVLVVLLRGRSGLKLHFGSLLPVWRDVRRILRISLPAAGESLTNVFCQLWFLGLINRLGPTATAAHGVAIRCEALAFLTVTAFSISASTLTGQYLGAGRPDLAARAAKTAWGIGLVVLSVVGTLLYFQGGAMFDLFLGGRQPAVVREGRAGLENRRLRLAVSGDDERPHGRFAGRWGHPVALADRARWLPRNSITINLSFRFTHIKRWLWPGPSRGLVCYVRRPCFARNSRRHSVPARWLAAQPGLIVLSSVLINPH